MANECGATAPNCTMGRGGAESRTHYCILSPDHASRHHLCKNCGRPFYVQ